MLPIVLILAGAVIGAYAYGFWGFFIGGLIALLGAMLLGRIIKAFTGGLMPRKVKDQVATDFVAAHPELLAKAAPFLAAYQVKELAVSLLEEMMGAAMANAPLSNINAASHPSIFVPSALQVADKQTTKIEGEIAHALVEFCMSHPLLYGGR